MSARSYGVESLSSAQVAFFKVFHLLKALRHTKAARCAQLAAVRICPHSPLGVWACSATATCSFPPSWTLPWYARRVTAGGSACQRAWGCPRTSRIAGWVASLARIRPRWSATERGRKSTRSTVRWVRPRATLRAGWAGDPPAPSLPPSLSRALALTHPPTLSVTLQVLSNGRWGRIVPQPAATGLLGCGPAAVRRGHTDLSSGRHTARRKLCPPWCECPSGR